MKLEFLGTGAADWNIRDRQESAEFRRFSSVLVDGELLIDPGPHIFDYAACTGQPHLFDNLQNVIVTHSHPDHFVPESVTELCIETQRPLYGDQMIPQALIGKVDLNRLSFHPLPLRQTVAIGNYKITALKSNHGTDIPLEQTLNYLVERDGKRFFYGLDSGWLMYESWRVLRENPCDALIFEATIGDVPGDDRIFGHTSIAMLEIMLQTVRAQGALREGGQVYVSHMARTLHTNHAALIERLRPLGVIPAHDGMCITV